MLEGNLCVTSCTPDGNMMSQVSLLLLLLFGQLAVTEGGRKDWWTKKITNNFYTSGRLTARQLKYAAESGAYKSVLSVFFFGSNGGPVCDGSCDDFYPSTSEYLSIAQMTGIPYKHLPKTVSWLSSNGVTMFEKTVSTMPKPVLVHCYFGYSATGLTLLYLLKTRQLTCGDVFRQAAAIGYEYWTNPTYVSLASQLSGSSNACKPVAGSMTQNTMSSSWSSYWPAKRLSDRIYIAGQIQHDQICQLKQAGFCAIANMRKGPTTLVTNRPSQEEVTLLNIHSYNPSTYAKGGRQLRSNLLQARLDPNKPNSYISAKSKDNFESKNECEFGDHIGYNETTERQYLAAKEIRYYHVPVGGYFRYDEQALIGHYCVLKELFEEQCPVLFHCRTGTRSAYFAILYLAVSEGRSCSWALSVARSIGYDFSTYPLCRVIESFQDGRRQVPSCGTAPTRKASTPTADQVQPSTLAPQTSKQASECTGFGAWSSWTPCSKTCDIGRQTKTRTPIPENCHRATLKVEKTRFCQNRPCVLNVSNPRLARRLERPCKAVTVHNVSVVVPDCVGSTASVLLQQQRWCLGRTSGVQSVCSFVKSKTMMVSSPCGDRQVLFALNKRCAEVQQNVKETVVKTS